jgi:hypothetical protein
LESDLLNKWLTAISNIGVLLGLAVLIYEVRQTNELTMAQIEQSRSESNLEWLRAGATDDYLAPLRAKLNQLGGEYSDTPYDQLGAVERQEQATYVLKQLDPIELVRVRSMLGATYWDWENLFFQYQRGLVSDAYWNERIVPSIIREAPRFKAAFGGALPTGRKEFNEEIERILSTSDQ